MGAGGGGKMGFRGGGEAELGGGGLLDGGVGGADAQIDGITPDCKSCSRIYTDL